MSWGFDYTIDVDEKDSVIYVKIYGKWKEETAERYHRDFKAEIDALSGRPWAKLVDLTNWKTSYDEVTDVLGKHMSWSRDNDIGLSLYVIDNTSTFRQLNEMFAKGGTKDISHTFRTYAEAERFLKQNWPKK
ncbi:MAG: hypothetical protein KKA42_07120 [candidate division Zixibacteria bacterium]|nr:hypothetical protein [candidate division Zixibacteria bacterium]